MAARFFLNTVVWRRRRATGRRHRPRRRLNRRRNLTPRIPRRLRLRWRKGIINLKLRWEMNMTITKTGTAVSYMCNRLMTKLTDFLPKSGQATYNFYMLPWQYYRIRGLQIKFLPKCPLINQNRRWGYTVIDLDGNLPTPTGVLNYNPLMDHSSAKLWTNTRPHSRYFVPRPDLDNVSNTMWFQPQNRRNQCWISIDYAAIPHHGLAFCMMNNTEDMEFQVLFTAYVQFMECSLMNMKEIKAAMAHQPTPTTTPHHPSTSPMIQ
nr:cap protein [Bat circovirus BtSY1]